jgi:microcystin-dependent protein
VRRADAADRAEHRALLGRRNDVGGDGETNFALPKLAPLAADGPQYLIAVEGVYPSRD